MPDSKRPPTESLATIDELDLGEPRLVWAPASGEEQSLVVDAGGIEIGKDEAARLRIDDRHVSGRHARVALTDAGVLIEDLGSRNGTFVNGVPVTSVVVRRRSLVTVGGTPIRLEFGGPPPTGERFHGAIGVAESMRNVFAILTRLAATEVSVMLLGETGTGKDVMARAIHRGSARADGPFAVFDCGAVAPNLIESDLFGHRKGAFTGAVADREGVFERGHGGTVFLDEIGELPLDLQPRLLRVLEQRAVTRVGGEETHPVDVRVVSATNSDLSAAVAAGRFRKDLYFRLSAAVVDLPPLRQRLEDLPALVGAFLADLDGPAVVAPATLEALGSYDWPGNVRELRNVIESAAALADGPVLEPRHLLFFRHGRSRAPTLDNLPLAGQSLERLERAAIKQTLDRTGGNKAQAARILGIASSTLYEKIKKYDL